MTDIPSTVPPSPPPGNAPQLTLADLVVLKTPDLPLPVKGTVTAGNPQTQELRIRTALGEVVVQSPVMLPAGTEVLVQVYTEKTQLRATIAVLKHTILQSQHLDTMIPPASAAKPATPAPPQPTLPVLQEGQTVTALLLPQQPPLTTAEIIQAVEKMKMLEVQKFHLPLPPQLLQSLFAAPDIRDFLKKLPPWQLAQIIRFISENNLLVKQTVPETMPLPAPKPDIIRQLLSAYLPQIFSNKPDIPAMVESAAPDVFDNNLLQIIRAQLHAKAAQQSIHQAMPDTPKTPLVYDAPKYPHPNLLPEGERIIRASLPSFPLGRGEGSFTALFRQLVPETSRATAPVPQNMYRLDVLKILPPGTSPEKITIALQKITAVAPPQPIYQAEVEASTSEGLPILKTADSHFVVRAPVSLPAGSVVIFKAIPLTPEQIIATLHSEGPVKLIPAGRINMAKNFDPLHSFIWPALQEALKALPSATPAAQAFRNTLPTPSAHLVPTTLFFIAALRRGAIDGWLGNNTLQALQQAGKGELAERLGADFSKISGQSREPLGDNWRGISMPLLHNEQVSQMQFYVRQQYADDGGKGGREKPATRFILNLHLSRMGEMQLDGFVQKKNFDIILRTEEKLPFDMRQELMKRFAQGLDQVRMQGAISFQTRQQGWIVPETGNPHSKTI